MEEIRWAPRVPQEAIRRAYECDAAGLQDMDALEEAACALLARCESILAVTRAHAQGLVKCPRCSQEAHREGELLACACGWQMSWEDFHRTYRKKKLFGANATPFFRTFAEEYPRMRTYQDKMMCVDRLIHAFHSVLLSAQADGRETEGLEDAEEGRPVAANLIEGKLGDVIRFLNELDSPSRDQWRQRLRALSWSKHFLDEDACIFIRPTV